DLERPDVERGRPGDVQAGDRRHRSGPHRDLREDAHVHAVDDSALTPRFNMPGDRPIPRHVSFVEDAPPSKAQVRDLLLRMLREMQPEFVEHIPVLREHARATALQLGLGDEAVEEVSYAAELHDIGKLAIPETMLTKPSALDEEEWALMRRHTVIGERML